MYKRQVFISLTKNKKRKKQDIASPNTPNLNGYILQLTPKNKSHKCTNFSWEIIINANKRNAKDNLANPDNLIFDSKGNLWVATDGMEKSQNISDSIYKIDLKNNSQFRLLNAPRGSEICGPEFTPNGKNLFLAIQHPGEDSSYESPSTRWPKFKKDIPPLPSIIVIEKI